ncbi:MAG TPA: GNAT family N-acetyltransferase [Candidatus Binatia bacterium]|nr:GNAT family N-acetyltransferase [Candidatus Binatia bacterium]
MLLRGLGRMEIIRITDDAGAVVAPDWLARAEAVHRQLRERLPPGYAGVLRRVFAGGGRMVVAAEGGAVAGVAVYRIHENTHAGVQLYVDDLVTDAAQRSRGVGRALLDWLARHGRERGCELLALDSGTQRTRAHAFYFREGMPITAFHFSRRLG